MSSWLDTQTQAILTGEPPRKLAPPDTIAYSLLLLGRRDPVDWQTIRAVQRIRGSVPKDAEGCLAQSTPALIERGLTYADAMLGQFELVCCDSVAVFVRDSVVEQADEKYLYELYECLLQSPEFAATPIWVNALPDNAKGDAYINQFLVTVPASYPQQLIVPYKMARIMHHWARLIGGNVSL